VLLLLLQYIQQVADVSHAVHAHCRAACLHATTAEGCTMCCMAAWCSTGFTPTGLIHA
jgi:hypothetical protein